MTGLLARRPFVSAMLTMLAIVALLRLRGPEHVTRRALTSVHPGRHVTAPPAPRPTAKATHSPTPSPSATRHRRHRTTAAPTVAPTRSRTPTPAARTSYTGDVFDTPYGPVQVRMVVSGTRITDVVALQLPDGSSRSREINDYAAPQLRQEALDAQSANIDTVSGATYTSDAYASSLQSAIDQWPH